MTTLAGLLLTAGGILMLLGAVGLLRMPDLYLRMAATSKASTLGAAFVLLGAAAHFGSQEAAGRAVVIVAFLFLTAPTAAHAIARAAFRRGTRCSPGTIVAVREERSGGAERPAARPWS